jgi:hypothetical protein
MRLIARRHSRMCGCGTERSRASASSTRCPQRLVAPSTSSLGSVQRSGGGKELTAMMPSEARNTSDNNSDLLYE